MKNPLLPALSVVLLTACGSTTPQASARKTIEVALSPKSGSSLSGKAKFVDTGSAVQVTVDVAGAPPGKIATHVHEKGDCSAPDATSAGDHFNPAHHQHALPPGTRHLGDLGNIEVKADGTGSTTITVEGANLKDNDPNSYLGRAIIVHQKEDDGGQPAGNAGGRIGCAVIR